VLVLGIDPGLATTGYGLVRENEQGLQAIAYGIVTTRPDQALTERLQTLYRELSALIAQHRPDTAAVEELFFSRNVRTAMSVGQARGVALLALADAGLSVTEYTPLTIKQSISGYGGADKHQMQMMVQRLLDLNDVPRPDDAADALAVAICHLHSAKWSRLVEGSHGDGP
jgi:crossover junction endodeoxyribonuclease RuvC